jgi:hypothetical protein
MNLFRYCGDDPVNGSDPTGLHDLGDEAELAAWNSGVIVTGSAIDNSLYDPFSDPSRFTTAGLFDRWSNASLNDYYSNTSHEFGLRESSSPSSLFPVPTLGVQDIPSSSVVTTSSARKAPDFYQANFAFPLLRNKFGGQIAFSVALNPLRLYFGLGPSFGQPANYGASVTANDMLVRSAPSADTIDSLLTGSSFNFGGAPRNGSVVIGSYTPGTGPALGVGIDTRGTTVGYMYSWEIYH